MTNGDMIKALFPNLVYKDGFRTQRLFDGENLIVGDIANCWWNAPYQPKEKESAIVAKFHDFYPEDPETWPPADEEILVKRHNGDNIIAYAAYDDSEDGGWGFYSEDGYLIADIDEIAAWMPIPQHERDKNYIPVWEREKKTIPAETHEGMDEDTEEEKDR